MMKESFRSCSARERAVLAFGSILASSAVLGAVLLMFAGWPGAAASGAAPAVAALGSAQLVQADCDRPRAEIDRQDEQRLHQRQRVGDHDRPGVDQ